LPVLARPFFDVSTGLPGSQLIAFPGLLAGGVNVSSFSKLKGCEANAICNCKCCYDCDNGCYWQGGRLDVLAGVRYLELREGLTITENILVPAGVPALGTFPNIGGLPLVAGDRIGVEDRFRTENRFYGAQVGLRGEYAFGNGVFVSATGKLAVGIMQQEVDIRGVTAVVTPAGAAVAGGGLLAQPSNSGNFERDRWAIVPELNVNVGFQVDRNVRVFVGYTYLAATHVVRPGDVIDTVVNSTGVPTSLVPATGAARPALFIRDSDFWAQGFSIGAEVRY
jgi:Putative beta barrel porin-7 (BBP7)